MNTLKLESKQFTRENYPDYELWFVEAELNRRLGPMDSDWLEAVLAEPESDGVTWAAFRGAELVAVIETLFDQWIIERHRRGGITRHVAYISADNAAAIHCFESVGFAPMRSTPDEHGYIGYGRDD